MPSMALNLIIRNARPQDHTAVTEVLAAALAEVPTARRLHPDPGARDAAVRDHVDLVVQDGLARGVVRVAEENRVVIAATVWSFLNPPTPPREDHPDNNTDTDTDTGAGAGAAGRAGLAIDGRVRQRVLDRLLREHHPQRPHHHLALIGVRADRRRQGLADYLLIGYHALLHTTGTPASVYAHDTRSRALFLRHRYTDLGDPIMLPDGTQVQPMWRNPVTADPLP